MERDSKGWIRVEDELPKEDTYVLVVCSSGGKGYVDRKCLAGGEWLDGNGWKMLFSIVTHWQPLPELPEGIERVVLP
jgi:hypothetical protein